MQPDLELLAQVPPLVRVAALGGTAQVGHRAVTRRFLARVAHYLGDLGVAVSSDEVKRGVAF